MSQKVLMLGLGLAIVTTSLGYFLYSRLGTSKEVSNEEPPVLDEPQNKPSDEKLDNKPVNNEPAEDSMGKDKNINYQDNSFGVAFKNFLLSENADKSKWEAKYKKLETQSPKSKLFGTVKTNLGDKTEATKNICKQAYGYTQPEWNKATDNYGEGEPDLFWEDVWSFCSADETRNKPANWPPQKN